MNKRGKYNLKSKIINKEESDNEDDLVVELVKRINNDLYFYGDVTSESVLELNMLIKTIETESLILSIKLNIDPPPIILHICSDGGEVYSALSTVDTIINCKVPVHSIVEGTAASAATLISVVCDKRYITQHSYMLIHQLSSGSFWGKMNEIEDEMKNLKKIMTTIKKIYSKYSELSIDNLDTVLRKDLLWSSKKCKTVGLIDDIL